MRKLGAVLATVTLLGLSGCGEEKSTIVPLQPNSSRVALTLTYPGFAPSALITYRLQGGRPCHALGMLTGEGPRVLAAPEWPLEAALERQGHCLDGRLVSLEVVTRTGSERLRVVGGLVRRDVARIRVAGQRVRPGRGGAFLIVQPVDAGSLGRAVEVELRDGSRRRLPLGVVAG
jgi:hypothetical protein